MESSFPFPWLPASNSTPLSSVRQKEIDNLGFFLSKRASEDFIGSTSQWGFVKNIFA
jgi:hypothetical protein